MLEMFTEEARRAVMLAQDAARRLAHPAIGPEHLLIGAVSVAEGETAFLLDRHGLSADRLERLLDERAGGGALTSEGSLPFTEAARDVLRLARKSLNVEDAEGVRTVDLLRALLVEDSTATVLVSQVTGVEQLWTELDELRLSPVEPELEHLAGDLREVEDRVAAESGVPGIRAQSREPTCPACRAELRHAARSRRLSVPDAKRGGESLYRILYCVSCGHTLDATHLG